MALKKEWLVFAGEMAIVSAVITIPCVIAQLVLTYFDGLVPKISSGIITLIMLGFFIYLITMFKKILNELFHYPNTNFYISALIGLGILNLPIEIMYYIYENVTPISTVLIVLNILFMVISGVLTLLFAFRLLDIPHELYGYRKSYCYALIITGASFAVVICFPIGYIASVVSDVLLGLIFFKAAEQISVEPAPEI